MELFDQRTTSGRRITLKATHNIRSHWPEYLMEAGELAVYMFSTCLFATLLQHPASPVRHAIPADLSRRAVMGLAIGTTVGAMILSPWGQQSGGHFNPALTLAFFRLGKLEPWDALFYPMAQFLGAIAGVAVASYLLRDALASSAVRYAVTVPAMHGKAAAFFAETAISFVLMITILFVSNREVMAPYTAHFVGALYAIFVTFETPLSGMSMNPARTFASALYASYWHALWIYFIAPTLGMLLAAEVFLYLRGGIGPFCAKLHHANNRRCIFHHSQQGVSFGKKFHSEQVNQI
jgi:aquaporin Z